MGSVVHQLFGHPHYSFVSLYTRAMRRINHFLRNYCCLLQNMIALKKAQNDLESVARDVGSEKVVLSKKIELTWSTLMKLRVTFLELKDNEKDTFMTKSDIQVKLSEYERCKELYGLFNHIDDLVCRTLAETERIEKLAFYCKQFDSLNAFKISNSVRFENTLESLLGHMAQFDKTKEYINSQLSIARASNISTAVTLGNQVDKATSANSLNRFLLSGCVGEIHQSEKKTYIKSDLKIADRDTPCKQPAM